jgi:hypothetical protein
MTPVYFRICYKHVRHKDSWGATRLKHDDGRGIVCRAERDGVTCISFRANPQSKLTVLNPLPHTWSVRFGDVATSWTGPPVQSPCSRQWALYIYWLLQIPPGLTLKNLYICGSTHCIYVFHRFVTAVITSLHSVNQQIFLTEVHCVLHAARTKPLGIKHTQFSLQRIMYLKWGFQSFLLAYRWMKFMLADRQKCFAANCCCLLQSMSAGDSNLYTIAVRISSLASTNQTIKLLIL